MQLNDEQLQTLLGVLLNAKSEEPKQQTPHLASKYIDKYVIVRGTNQNGVFAGILKKVDADGCVIERCRRLWWWENFPGKGDFLEGISLHGTAESSKLSAPVEEQILNGWCQVYLCTEEARRVIEAAPIHNG